jgi:hypothetical protein
MTDKQEEYKGVEIYCNYCSFPHTIFDGRSTCPQCGKPAGMRPTLWTEKPKKLWETGHGPHE